MNGGVFIFAILFAVAGYGEAKRCRERYGRYPFGWPPVVWAVVMFLSWLIGLVLLAIAERIVRSAAAKMPQQMFVQPVPMQSMYAPAGYAPPGVPAGVELNPFAPPTDPLPGR